MLESLAGGLWGVEVAVGAMLLLPALTYLYWRISRGPGASLFRGKVPPVEGGWIPWLGCALTFGKEPLWFIKKAHKKVLSCWLQHL